MAGTTHSESVAPSRRALLAGALGGLGAVAASAIGRVTSVRAANGDPVTVGNNFTGTSDTKITTTSQVAWDGVSSATNADAVRGSATAATGGAWGVRGVSNSSQGSGVVGQAFAVTGNPTGVRGDTSSPDGNGVVGTGFATSGASIGVKGQSLSPGGIGVLGVNQAGGFGLRSIGRTKFSTSGVATITAGSTSKTVIPGVNIVNGTFVLLTAKSNIGTRSLWFTTNPTTNRFAIHMSSAKGSSTKVAWLLLG